MLARRTPRGRRSWRRYTSHEPGRPRVSSRAIGLDVGGTKMAAAVIDAAGSVFARSSAETPADDAEATVGAMIRLGRDLVTPDVGAVGVGAAGRVGRAGTPTFSPNLAWREGPLAERLRGGLRLPRV